MDAHLYTSTVVGVLWSLLCLHSRCPAQLCRKKRLCLRCESARFTTDASRRVCVWQLQEAPMEEEKRAERAGPEPAFPSWAWQTQGSPAPFLPATATAASSGFSTAATTTGVDAATAARSVPPSLSGGPRQLFSGYQLQLRFPPTA